VDLCRTTCRVALSGLFCADVLLRKLLTHSLSRGLAVDCRSVGGVCRTACCPSNPQQTEVVAHGHETARCPRLSWRPIAAHSSAGTAARHSSRVSA